MTGLRARAVLGALAALWMVLAWSAMASAHVTVSPTSLPQGTGDAILTFRVPNESATAEVVGLKVQFPLDHPIAVLSPEAGSGWQTKVVTQHLAKPVSTDDGTFTSGVAEIDWSGNTIPVGQFAEFNVLAQGIPSGTSELVFKTVQLYSDGTSVDWIQVPSKAVPDPSHPAPVLQLTRDSGTTASTAPPAAQATVGVGTSVSDGGSNWLAILAVILAAAAVVVAVLSVWLSRPRRGSGVGGSPSGPG
jgi:uncharacterized protein YcnI